MSLENPKGIESSVSKNTKQRRTFLKRATAGAAIASIPGRSAWAGIAGSIVASGHGSDFQQGDCTLLKPASSFNPDNYNDSFASLFPGKPFKGDSTAVRDEDLTFKQILLAPSGSWKAGINDVNIGLVVMYLNAKEHDGSNPNYPVLTQHGTIGAFASYLYNNASNGNAGTIGTLLNDTIYKYSNLSACV